MILARFVEWLFPKPWTIVSMVDAADEAPEALPRNAAVLVGSREHLKWLIFDCPCRREHRIMLNLDKGRRPHWSAGVDKANRLSVSPSIDHKQSNGRRCHYFIRAGRTLWVKDDDDRG